MTSGLAMWSKVCDGNCISPGFTMWIMDGGNCTLSGFAMWLGMDLRGNCISSESEFQSSSSFFTAQQHV